MGGDKGIHNYGQVIVKGETESPSQPETEDLFYQILFLRITNIVPDHTGEIQGTH